MYLGYRYDDSPIVMPDGNIQPEFTERGHFGLVAHRELSSGEVAAIARRVSTIPVK